MKRHCTSGVLTMFAGCKNVKIKGGSLVKFAWFDAERKKNMSLAIKSSLVYENLKMNKD